MKKLLIILLICSVYCFTACKKGNSISPNLFGKWELRRTYGGFGGMDSVYKAGNGNILQFNRDSTYKRFEANKLVSQGAFHIKKYSPGYGIFFDNTTYGDAFEMKGTTITIGTTVTDGVASDYQKVSN
ncbi:MAG TPA: hypothetical protein VL442_08355 [Mucilaginibacter sp.]|nr:hypothetical protein [Mucilaginibacter sp.]